MTDTTSNSPAPTAALPQCPTGRWWLCALLGLVWLAGGVFVLWNAVVASLVTALFFAAALIVGGIFQIVHAFSARGWGSLTLSLIIGILLVGSGLLLATSPLATSLGLTLAIAVLFLAGGALRLWLAARHWRDHGWLLTISGLLSLALGVVLILGFPWSGLVVPGILLGVDLVFQGAWWLTVGLWVRRPHEGGHFAHA
ncbi:MAG: HdeD family acid-resistance protein [Pseudolabrys sp.]|jgi:uncharacterized membrane protein HdeD (DUF308 family)